jgi:hypothetical protein
LAYSIFDCSNLNLFLLNLTQANSLYSIIFSNFTTSFFVYIFPLYNNAPGPAPFNYTCNSTNSTICIIIIDINCTSDYSANIIETIVTDLNGETITKFEYNTVCNNEMYGYIYQIQWGIGIVVLLSIIIIFASSKFQRA